MYSKNRGLGVKSPDFDIDCDQHVKVDPNPNVLPEKKYPKNVDYKLDKDDQQLVGLINRFNACYKETSSLITMIELTEDDPYFNFKIDFVKEKQIHITSVVHQSVDYLEDSYGLGIDSGMSYDAAMLSLYDTLKQLSQLVSSFNSAYLSNAQMKVFMKIYLAVNYETIQVESSYAEGCDDEYKVTMNIHGLRKPFYGFSKNEESAKEEAFEKLVAFLKVFSKAIYEEHSVPNPIIGNLKIKPPPSPVGVESIKTGGLETNAVELLRQFLSVVNHVGLNTPPEDIIKTLIKLEPSRYTMDSVKQYDHKKHLTRCYLTTIKVNNFGSFSDKNPSKHDSKRGARKNLFDRLDKLCLCFKQFQNLEYEEGMSPVEKMFRLKIDNEDVIKVKCEPSKRGGNDYEAMVTITQLNNIRAVGGGFKEAEEKAFEYTFNYLKGMVPRVLGQPKAIESETAPLMIQNVPAKVSHPVITKWKSAFSSELKNSFKIPLFRNEQLAKFKESAINLVTDFYSVSSKKMFSKDLLEQLYRAGKEQGLIKIKKDKCGELLYFTKVTISSIGEYSAFGSDYTSPIEAFDESAFFINNFCQMVAVLNKINYSSGEYDDPLKFIQNLNSIYEKLIQMNTIKTNEGFSVSLVSITDLCAFASVAINERDAKLVAAIDMLEFLIDLSKNIHDKVEISLNSSR